MAGFQPRVWRRAAWSAARVRHEERGIVVCDRRFDAVEPAVAAAVRTAIFDQMKQEHIDFMPSKIPLGRFGLAEEIAAMVAWLASPGCSFSTDAVFDISGGRATY